MTSPELTAFWLSAGLYAVATILAFAGLAWSGRPFMRWALTVATVGVGIHAVAIGLRWIETGHLPYVKEYENVLAGSFAIMAGYVLLGWLRRELSVVGVVVLPVVLLTMGYGVSRYTEFTPVGTAYQSSWLVIHVNFAWITYATYCLAAGLAVAQLLRKRAERRGVVAKGVPGWIPPDDSIDDISLKLVAFGFLNNAVMIASGSIWAYRLWGAYWRWDPVETWSLLTWLVYGFYLHARLTLGWRGLRLAWLALFALVGVLMMFWGVQLVPNTYHLFRNISDLAPTARF